MAAIPGCARISRAKHGRVGQKEALDTTHPPKPLANRKPAAVPPSREAYELPDDAVIDADALAKWLGKKRSWVIETANQRRRHKLRLPALKIGREWRFRVGDIRTWLANLAHGTAV